VIWSLFKTAVNAAIDERNKEARRTRALERIAAALEEHNGIIYDFQDQSPPPKGNP
jgi:hypothetical protein